MSAISTRPFGATGIQVPKIGLGCYNLTSDRGVDRETALAVLQRAYELGVRFFDTAPLYGAGECDELLGEAFGHLGDDEVMIGAKMSGPADTIHDYTYDGCMRAFEESLKSLRRDSVFALQIHGIQGIRNFDSQFREWRTYYNKGMAFEALLELKAQGLTRTIGATGHNSVFLADALKEFPLDSVEIASHCNILSQVAEQTLLPLTAKKNVATIIANPIGSGRLVDLDRFAKAATPGGLPHDQAVPLLEEVMEETGRMLYELALLYLLADKRVTFPIPGPRTVEELEADVGVAWLPRLSPDQIEKLRRIGTRQMVLKVVTEDGAVLEGMDLRPEWIAGE